MMRIIAGEYRGRRLQMTQDASIRPATARVKGSIFNMLQNRLSLFNANVLDLFAGSGSLSFEALSRGAKSVVLVDTGRSAIDVMNNNVQMLHCEDKCTILQADAMEYIAHCREKFDLIFADPPYRYEDTSNIPEQVFDKNLLRKDGFLIIEHSKDTVFEESKAFIRSVQKEYGGTLISFFNQPNLNT
ncbi:MAG: 16S rRNA (guanine(966)-N(2))-methyltransferase RsmD [Bacteroidota bacterium]